VRLRAARHGAVWKTFGQEANKASTACRWIVHMWLVNDAKCWLLRAASRSVVAACPDRYGIKGRTFQPQHALSLPRGCSVLPCGLGRE
jgi:hypothetical protein